MKKYFSNFDWFLFGTLLTLLVFDLFIIASASPDLFFRQLISIGLGLFLFFLFSQIDHKIYERFSFIFFFGSVVFLMLPFFFGLSTRGSTRWIQAGRLTVQPSEIVKPFLIIFFANFFAQTDLGIKRLIVGGLLMTLPVLLIFLQPDLGSSLVVIFVWSGIVLASGLDWRLLVIGMTSFMAGLPFGWGWLKQYQRQRILSFLNPLKDPLGTGYNLIQATVAVGSGQLLGRGLGRGTQSQLKFLPEARTDFVFAALSEELGFIGGIILLSVFFILFWRILVICRETESFNSYLVCLGVFSAILFQFFVNIGMNLGLLPITGVTLPLISYGGSSLVSVMISLGIVENVARSSKNRKTIEIR